MNLKLNEIIKYFTKILYYLFSFHFICPCFPICSPYFSFHSPGLPNLFIVFFISLIRVSQFVHFQHEWKRNVITENYR